MFMLQLNFSGIDHFTPSVLNTFLSLMITTGFNLKMPGKGFKYRDHIIYNPAGMKCL